MRLSLVARLAAGAAALLAVVATVSAMSSLLEGPETALVVETWRVVGLATWAAIFALLVARPRLVAVWVIATLSKLALAIAGVALGDVVGASDLIVWDGLLTGVLGIGAVASFAMWRRDRRGQARV